MNPPLNEQKDPFGRQYQGTLCKHNGDCASGLKCGHPGTSNSHKICCPFGTYHPGPLHESIAPYCKDLPDGYYCLGIFGEGEGCRRGGCGHPQGDASAQTICCYSGQTKKDIFGRPFCTGHSVGSTCTHDIECSSHNCDSGTCSAPKTGFLGQLEMIILYGFIVLIAVIIIIVIF